METLKHPLFKILFLSGILVLIAIPLMAVRSPKTSQFILLPSPTPTPAPETNVHSLDGTLKLIMRTKTADSSTSYSFFTADTSGKNEKPLFAKTVTSETTMLLPANSWSPDNKLVFLRENGPSSFNILVFKVSGDPFSNNQLYLSVVPLFVVRKTGYYIADVTGWDSDTLLHVKTTGPSYWFDVDSLAFLQLASR